ncbi:MAG: hypothetical protein M1837_004385 [Sclerophora amabilis]|nr:MAG: hypothetical protein M1837_004385 [Sclerophora amabilis]
MDNTSIDAVHSSGRAKSKMETPSLKESEPAEEVDHVVKSRLGPRLRQHLRAEVSSGHADILLLWCCLISGLLDSTVYNGMLSVFLPGLARRATADLWIFTSMIALGTFVSMQTGNTIFTGLGASNPDTSKPYGWAKSLMSIMCFIFGSLFFSRFCRFFGPLRRSTLIYSFLLQTILIFVTAAVIQAGAIDGSVQLLAHEIQWKELVPIGLLSFQSSGQIVGSRNLGLNEIPTVVITSVLCDLMSDQQLVSPLRSNAKRNRRVLAFFGILVGAIVGGFIADATGGMEVVLWISGGIKLLITCAWALWPENPHLPI